MHEIPEKQVPETFAIPAPMVYVREAVQWEYKRIDCDISHGDVPTAESLNALGKEGWELITQIIIHDKFLYLYFKRRV